MNDYEKFVQDWKQRRPQVGDPMVPIPNTKPAPNTPFGPRRPG
jgi:hypothetical protein